MENNKKSWRRKLKTLLSLDMDRILDDVGPHLILHKIFQPYSCLIRLFGILPFRIKEGVVTLKFLSAPTFYTLICYSAFISDSIMFIPMYTYLIRGKGSQGVTHVAQVMFISNQYFGAALSYLLVPYTTPKFVRYFVSLNEIIERISRLTSSREFLPAYVAARWKMRIWLLSSFSFTVFCVYSYRDGVEIYLAGESDFIYYMYYLGFCCFPFMISFHILYSMIFSTIAITLKSCFSALTKEAESLRGGKDISKGIELYVQINDLVTSLGEVYGIYVLLEIIIMMTCITANLFFVISQFEEVNWSGFYVYALVILPYVFWFHWICSIGESLNGQGVKCLKAIKKLALKDQDKNLWMILDNPAPLSASVYFNINMRLFTTVIGTITTYLLVMLQFKVDNPCTQQQP